jgi:hypothetical protein
MNSDHDKYEKHVEELAKGLFKNNRHKSKVMGYNIKKLTEIIKKEITYSDFVLGRRVKKINVNGMEFNRKTSFASPMNFQDPLEIKTLH